jgi:hypothetical protein
VGGQRNNRAVTAEAEPSDAPATSAPRRVLKFLTQLLFGDKQTISGTVYGTIIILAVIAAEARGYEGHMWQLGGVAFMTAVVLWLAHVYAHGLGESVKEGRRLTPEEVGAIARREYAIVLSAVPPVAAIIAGSTHLIDEHSAYRLATALGIAALAFQGIRYATIERLGFAGTALAIALNLVFGLGIVLAEVWVAH